jgi:hypothetical protein
VFEKKLKWENIRHPTSNTQHPEECARVVHWLFDVGCWMLDVSVFELPCQPLHPSHHTPATGPENPAW